MANITYEELPRAAQEIYLKKTKGRKIRLIIQWVLVALAIVGGIISGIAAAAKGEEDALGYAAGLIFMYVMLITMISGLDHLGYMFKKAVKNGIGLVIILGIWYIVVFAGICMLAMLSGWVFLIVDSIRFLTKKPLISQKEIAGILEKEQVQAELLVQAYSSAATPSASDRLAELKEMLDGGLITAEEFEAKKQEVLSEM